ncbi:hypothetical protein B566_EDAN007210 [Ephemera danica]|nr:hypothetical protein B566_EDAN007210 [Ephemera danica]
MAEAEEALAIQEDLNHDVICPEVEAKIAAVTNGVAEVQEHIRQLQQFTLERTDERETLRTQLQEAEKRLTELPTINLGDQEERTAVQETLEKLTATLKEQTGQCERFERQNTQLHSQVKALKEVISVHKDLLAIRSLESDQLKTTIKLLEQHAQAEKDRRAAVLAKMEAAVRLNGELKTEYETQLRIFQDLKGKYETKVELLTQENQRLCDLLPPETVAEQEIMVPIEEVAEQ